MTAMLNIKDLRAYYGQVQALHDGEFWERIEARRRK